MQATTLRRISILIALALIQAASIPSRAEDEQQLSGLTIHNLKNAGPTGNARETEDTYRKLLDMLTKESGGIVIVPEDIPTSARLENVARWSHSVDPASCSLKDWKVGPGVLVIDNRQGNTVLRVPQIGKQNNAGITLERTLRLPPGDSLTHWTEESILNIENTVIHGTCNYMEWTLLPTKAGKDARFYIPTARNLFKGMFLNAHRGPGYSGKKVSRITVKDIGWDTEKKMHYFTADTFQDHAQGAIVQNKSHAPGIRMVNNMNAANQTFFFYNKLNQYANGDSYIFEATFDYMGNVHSMPGDENGNCYAALIHSLANSFVGKVKSIDNAAGTLVFKKARNAKTLANTRPLINLNENKWVTAGKVLVVPPNNPEAPYMTIDEGRWKYEGKSYPSHIGKNPSTGDAILVVGGLIRGDKDCPWDDSLIGRFFAIDEPTEYVSARQVRPKMKRWYEIASITVNKDGTKDMQVKRYWWGAKAWNSVTLYAPENYTRDGNIRPLSYVIAPGAYVNNVSDAVGGPGQNSGKPPFTLGITPHPDTGNKFDFEPEDPIEQAIGADPFKPQGLRLWCDDAVPGAWPSVMIDISNIGPVARASAIMIHGGAVTLEDSAKRKDRRPPWDTVIRIDSAATVGLSCNADFADAAILFKQPNIEQPIKWHYGHEEGKITKEAVLTVSRDTGDFNLTGGDLRLSGSIIAQGISADETPAHNLRGKNVPVKKGKNKITVEFPVPEVDENYAVFVEQNWITDHAIVKKTANGFTAKFKDDAPRKATIDWMLVR